MFPYLDMDTNPMAVSGVQGLNLTWVVSDKFYLLLPLLVCPATKKKEKKGRKKNLNTRQSQCAEQIHFSPLAHQQDLPRENAGNGTEAAVCIGLQGEKKQAEQWPLHSYSDPRTPQDH